MPRDIDKEYIEPKWEDVIEDVKDDKTFSIGQSYDRKAATTIRCKICKNTAFTVGIGTHYTAIMCNYCQWQMCVQDG